MPVHLTPLRSTGTAGRSLLVALPVVLVALALAAPASARPKAPQLGGTYPSSPGTSITPRLFGSVGGEVFASRLRSSQGPVQRAEGGEEGAIAVYAQPECAGPVVATGSVSELEHSGIQVAVPLGLTKTFSATDSDLTGVSDCSNPVDYRQVSDPPASPTVTGVDPASPADNNLPHVLGSADAGSMVAIYANSSCSGSPLGSGPASLFASTGIQVTVPDNSTTALFASASWAGLPPACSSTSVTYQEVSAVAPGLGGGSEGGGGGGSGGGGGLPAGGSGSTTHSGPLAAPKLGTVPGGRSNNTLPLVTGSAPGATRVQIYKNAACGGRPAVAGPVTQLADGFPIAVAENATTRFYGEAIDADGQASDCSEPTPYVEDSSPPLTRITFGPGVKTRKRVAVFRFADVTDDPLGTTFLCKFDRHPWRPCQAPLKLPHLRPSAHTLRVKAIDVAGNEEAGGASRRFKVVRGL